MQLDLDPLPMEAVWHQLLHPEFDKPYMISLRQFLRAELAEKKVFYPKKDLVFNALCQTPFDRVKVVIMGQDPYHGEGQAEGLSFSVPPGVPIPPSLQNIYKELQADVGIARPKHGSLVSWAKQGVLLLNATLTVRAHEAKSHYGRGWEIFTDKIIQILGEKKDPLVFMLWGKSAIDKCQHVSAHPQHLVLTAPHPSPLSAYQGFLGCRHFSKANEFLKRHYQMEIDWNIPIETP